MVGSIVNLDLPSALPIGCIFDVGFLAVLVMRVATASNWVMNFIVSATFLSLQDAVSRPGAFWLYGVLALVGGVWVWWTMPETAGRSLEQIEELFKRR